MWTVGFRFNWRKMYRMGAGSGMVADCLTRDRKVLGSIPGRCQKVSTCCKYLPSLSCLLSYVRVYLLYRFVLLICGIEKI